MAIRHISTELVKDNTQVSAGNSEGMTEKEQQLQQKHPIQQRENHSQNQISSIKLYLFPFLLIKCKKYIDQ
jgi:hypothetical protein